MAPICLIVQSVYDFDPRVRRKAEALVAAGYPVDVFALRPDGGQASYTIEGVRVHTLSLGKRRGSLGRYAFEYLAFFLWAMARVTVATYRRRYAVIDVNTLPDFLIFAPFAARWLGAKLVLDMHEITPEFYISKYGIAETSWIVRMLKWQERISFRFADRVITINAPVEALLVHRGLAHDKCIIMMNAADEARFDRQPEPEHEAAAERFVMIYHGTLTRIYGLDIAVEAFARVHARMPGAEFWILGSGPEQGHLASLIRSHALETKVKLVGQVPGSRIPEWLAKSDVGVLPIRRDALLDFAFPNKLPEYIISGKAVIVSRLKAIRHYFSEDALAFAEPENPHDLSEQMLRLYRDRTLRQQLARQASTEYQPVRWEVMKARYLDMVHALAAPRTLGRHVESDSRSIAP
jgi:glycosyltransferase involved in cell wall biosynthesis